MSSHKDLFNNIDKITPANVWRTEATLGGPVLGEAVSFFASGVYNWYGGHLYGKRLYLPTDAYLSRDNFLTGDPRKGTTSDPWYFGPLTHASTNLVGGGSGDGAAVALKLEQVV